MEGTPCFRDIPPEFLSTICRCGTSVFHVSAPPTSLDGCDFFNSVVVRLYSTRFLTVLSDDCSIF